jgi:hypothetical protein
MDLREVASDRSLTSPLTPTPPQNASIAKLIAIAGAGSEPPHRPLAALSTSGAYEAS